MESSKGVTNMIRVSQNYDDFSFYAKTYDIKLLIQLLKAVKFKENAVFYCTIHGIKVTVEDMKCLQANSYLNASLFDEYKVKLTDEECVKFTANISVILDCLNILHSSGLTGVTLSYRTEGSPLKLLIEDRGVITDCEIRTLISEPVLNFSFESSENINKVVFFSEFFKEVLSDMDTTSELLRISITATEFILTTVGNGMTSKTDIPCDSKMLLVMELMVKRKECDSRLLSYNKEDNTTKITNTCTMCYKNYKLIHIKPALKPLQGSQKVSIQINKDGVLCLQYMILDEGQMCFVEYFCSAVFKVSVKSG